MIVYKLPQIKERLEEMQSNIRNIYKEGQDCRHENIVKCREEAAAIQDSDNYTKQGKEDLQNEIGIKYMNKTIKTGERLNKDIVKEYDSAIERIKEIIQMDNEKKIVNADDLKDNTQMLYVTSVLNSTDKDNVKILKELFEECQNERVYKLIKLKADKCIKDGANSSILTELMNNIKELEKDYVGGLEKNKQMSISDNKYPSYIPLAATLEETFGVKVGKGILDFAQN